MKKTIYILSSLMIAFCAFWGCTDDFEDTNKNPSKFYQIDFKYILPGTVYKTMNTIGDLNYNVLLNYSRYGVVQAFSKPKEPTGDTYYSKFYVEILRDIELTERACEGKEGFENRLAAMKTWRAYIYYNLASLFGGVIMTDAIDNPSESKASYKYDTELEVYTQILDLLEEACSLYDPTSKYTADAISPDPVFRTDKADFAKWRKFANTMRLNIAMHVQNLSPELSEKHAKAAMEHEDWLISSVDEIVAPQWGTDKEMDVSYYYTKILLDMENGRALQATTYPALSEYFALYLFSYKDPRIEVYAEKSNTYGTATEKVYLHTDTITRPHTCSKKDCVHFTDHQADGLNDKRRDSILVQYSMDYVPFCELPYNAKQWEGALIPGTESRYKDPLESMPSRLNVSYVKRDFLKRDAKVVLYSWADACFLKAEAKIKYNIGSKSAQEYYEEGIKASFAQYGMSGKVSDYLAQDGVKWNTDGKGFTERRGFYTADINGFENHLEQIYKQRYIAGFFNCLEAWNLERRTRILQFPPFFTDDLPSIEGGNATYNYHTERFIYPLSEISKNKAEYYKAVEALQQASPNAYSYRWGDNIFTSLAFAKKDPGLETADDKYLGNLQIKYNATYFNKKYGYTYEEVLATAKDMTGETNDNKALTKAFNYNQVSVLNTYLTE